MAKRKPDFASESDRGVPPKRARVQPSSQLQHEQLETGDATSAVSMVVEPSVDATQGTDQEETQEKQKQEHPPKESGRGDSTRLNHKIRKLVPPRPFPTVPASVSATGPRSAHTEGKNFICITRRTELGAYLRRCKDVFLKDGYKTLHLSAMGAAIPHLMQLALSLPSILPYPQDEIHTEVLTGTVEVQDELIPEDEDEDISYRTRGKSSVSVVIKVGDGVDEPTAGAAKGGGRKNNLGRSTATASGGSSRPGAKRAGKEAGKQGRKGAAQAPGQMVFREDEMDDS